MRLHASEDPRWSLYPATILEFRPPQLLFTIDLRRRLSDTEQRMLNGLWPSSTFGVITAFNPIGRYVSSVENEMRHEHLREMLTRSGVPHLRADGVSPDGLHCEEGFAVWLERAAVALLGVELEQSAFFWFDSQAFWVVGALVDAAPLRLPLVVG